MNRALAALLASLWLLLPSLAAAQSFPELTGRVVDAAHVLPPAQAQALDQKLAALEQQTGGRQLVVATIPDLQGYDIEDYGNRLGRAWKIGSKLHNDGTVLIVAPNERKVRIEVGYGLEGIITDGLSFLIIQQQILPKFKAGDLPGGIEAGTDALIQQLTLPPDQAKQVAAQARPAAKSQGRSIGPAIFWLALFFLFFILPMLRRGGGRRYGSGGGMGGWGPVILWDALSSMSDRRDGGGWGGGGGGDWGGGGGGGGFSGGGGSFGGGGASGSW
jgi:uncharacterized protein